MDKASGRSSSLPASFRNADWIGQGLSKLAGANGYARPVHDDDAETGLMSGLKHEPFRRTSSTDLNPAAQRSFAAQAVYECKGFFLDTKLNLLLLTFPFALAAKLAGWGDGATFVLSCLTLVPLAERLGFITEQLASYTSDTLGGLLNATFGNATEVIISGFALQHGYLRVVQLSLLGSIVSNLLLVMGSAFIAGGVKQNTQTFGQQGVTVNCGLLIFGVLAIILPSMLDATGTEARGKKSELVLSRFESICMLICYGLYLFFQLYTHRHIYEESEEPKRPETQASTSALPSTEVSTRANELELSSMANGQGASKDIEHAPLTQNMSNSTGDYKAVHTPPATVHGQDDEEEEQLLSLYGCFFWLAAVTVIIAVLSEWIMDAIKGASVSLGIPMPFLVTILLPIVGNAAEHASAIVFAYRNRIEISLGVALGSSTQVAVLVVPFCVVLAWMMGQPLDLDFNSFETATLFISVLLSCIVVQDGKANWLKGLMLVLTFFFISAGFWCHKDTNLSIDDLAGA